MSTPNPPLPPPDEEEESGPILGKLLAAAKSPRNWAILIGALTILAILVR